MFMGWCVGEVFIPPGMLAAAETSAGRRANRRLRAATGPGMPGPYRAALGQMLPVLQPQGGMPPCRRRSAWPPVQRVAAQGRRRGQDPSLRTNVHGCFVGSGLDRSVPVYGKPAFTGSHRAGHARPLPRGFGADVTCITAAGRHAYPIASAISASVRVLRTGCGSPSPSCRTITQ